MTPSRSRIVLGLAVIAAIIGLWIVLMQPAEAHGPYELHPGEHPVAEYLDAKAALWRLAADKCERLPVCPGVQHQAPERNAVERISADIPRVRATSAGVEQWRPLVERYFPAHAVDDALCILWFESRGDPQAANPQSSARGLFQHLARYWPDRSSAAGWPGADILDPEANVAVAAWLWQKDGWRHWTVASRC